MIRYTRYGAYNAAPNDPRLGPQPNIGETAAAYAYRTGGSWGIGAGDGGKWNGTAFVNPTSPASVAPQQNTGPNYVAPISVVPVAGGAVGLQQNLLQRAMYFLASPYAYPLYIGLGVGYWLGSRKKGG